MLRKSNRKSFVICRMDRNCFGFFHMFETNYFTKYATDLRDIFRIEMWLRSLKGRCHGNRFIFTHSTQFFRHSDQCVINSSTGSMVVKSTWTISVDNTYTPRNGRSPLEMDISPLDISLLLRHFLDTRVRRDTTRSTSAAWMHANHGQQ